MKNKIIAIILAVSILAGVVAWQWEKIATLVSANLQPAAEQPTESPVKVYAIFSEGETVLTVDENGHVVLPTITDPNFTGWYVNGEPVTTETVYTEDSIVRAVYGTPEYATIVINSSVDSQLIVGGKVNLPTITDPNFTGWYVNGEPLTEETVLENGDVIVAVFEQPEEEPDLIIVVLIGESSSTVFVDPETGVVTLPTITDPTFVGWYVNGEPLTEETVLENGDVIVAVFAQPTVTAIVRQTVYTLEIDSAGHIVLPTISDPLFLFWLRNGEIVTNASLFENSQVITACFEEETTTLTVLIKNLTDDGITTVLDSTLVVENLVVGMPFSSYKESILTEIYRQMSTYTPWTEVGFYNSGVAISNFLISKNSTIEFLFTWNAFVEFNIIGNGIVTVNDGLQTINVNNYQGLNQGVYIPLNGAFTLFIEAADGFFINRVTDNGMSLSTIRYGTDNSLSNWTLSYAPVVNCFSIEIEFLPIEQTAYLYNGNYNDLLSGSIDENMLIPFSWQYLNAPLVDDILTSFLTLPENYEIIKMTQSGETYTFSSGSQTAESNCIYAISQIELNDITIHISNNYGFDYQSLGYFKIYDENNTLLGQVYLSDLFNSSANNFDVFQLEFVSGNTYRFYLNVSSIYATIVTADQTASDGVTEIPLISGRISNFSITVPSIVQISLDFAA